MGDFDEIDDVLLNSNEIESLFEFDQDDEAIQEGGMNGGGSQPSGSAMGQPAAASPEGFSSKTHSSLRRVVYNCRQNSALRSESYGLETPKSVSSRRVSVNMEGRESGVEPGTEGAPGNAAGSESTVECAICLVTLQDLLSCKGEEGGSGAPGSGEEVRGGGGAQSGEAALGAGRPGGGAALVGENRELLIGGLSVCRHIFCFVCIKQWSDVATQCPLCKREFDHINAFNMIPSEFSIPVMVIPVETKRLNCNDLEEDPFADFACEICRLNDHEEVLLLCDRCDRGYHTYCLSPPLDSVPSGEWFCPSCSRGRRRRGNGRRNHAGRSNNSNLDDDQDFVLELDSEVSFENRVATRSSRSERSSRAAARPVRSSRHPGPSNREGGPPSRNRESGASASNVSVGTTTIRVVSVDSDSSEDDHVALSERRSMLASSRSGGHGRGRPGLSVIQEDGESDQGESVAGGDGGDRGVRTGQSGRPSRSGRGRRARTERRNRSGVSRRNNSRSGSSASGSSIMEMLEGAIQISSVLSSEYVDLTSFDYQEEALSTSVFGISRNKSSSDIMRAANTERGRQSRTTRSASSSSLNGGSRAKYISRQSIQTSLDISNYRIPRETAVPRVTNSCTNQASIFSGSQYSQSSDDESSIIELLENEERSLLSLHAGSAASGRDPRDAAGPLRPLAPSPRLELEAQPSPLFDSDENAASYSLQTSRRSASNSGKLHIYGDAS
ncbi:PHD domain-containing protein, partial [Cryptosporidium canis]